MENSTDEFLVLLEEETIMINGGGTKTAAAGAVGGALVGGLAGYGVGRIVTPVTGPFGVPACTAIGIVGGACEGFVQGW